MGSVEKLCNGVCQRAYHRFYDSDGKNRMLIQILSSAVAFCFPLFDRLEYWGDIHTVCATSNGSEN